MSVLKHFGKEEKGERKKEERTKCKHNLSPFVFAPQLRPGANYDKRFGEVFNSHL